MPNDEVVVGPPSPIKLTVTENKTDSVEVSFISSQPFVSVTVTQSAAMTQTARGGTITAIQP